MHNKIVIDIGKSERLYERYRKYFSNKKIPKLIDLQNHESVNDLLNKLAFFALNKDTTLPILYSFGEVFLDIVGRWITNQDEYERLYKEEHCLDRYQLNGSIVLEALSRIMNVSEGLHSTAEYYLSRSDIFARMLSLDERKNIDQVELSFFLLSFYRFITFNKDFEKYINTTVISRFIQPGTVISPASRYVAHLILLSMSNSSESKIHEVLAKNFDLSNPILGLYDGDEEIDYRFLATYEAKRISNYYSFKKLDVTDDTISVESDKLIEIDQSCLSPFAIPLSNILIPRLLDNTSTNSSSTKDFDIVPTSNSSAALHKLAVGIQKGDPILVTGDTGSGKTFLISQIAKYMSYHNLIVKIHLGEQTDVKLLIGTYQSGEKPGSFEWRPGALTTAVKEGKWVLIEDIDKAPTEVLSVLLTLLEKKELIIPSRGEVVKARAGFQLISTVRSSEKNRKELSSLIGLRLWKQVHIESPSEEEIEQILTQKFPLIRKLIKKFIACYQRVSVIYKSSSFIAYNKGSHPRLISVRDLIKLCSRCSQIMRNEGGQNGNEMLDASTEDYIFAEAVDCFGSAISDNRALKPVINAIGESLEIAQSRIELYIAKHVPSIIDDDYKVRVGRSLLWKNNLDVLAPSSKKSMKNFALTNHSLRLIEQLGVSIQMKEPVLLVGETGTGKTTVVQHLANMVGKKLTVINLSQQTESSDLLGGYKPINSKTAVVPIQEVFDDLFKATFSMKKNDRFYQALMKFLNKSQWKAVVKLWKEASKMAFGILEKSDSDESAVEAPKKKRKLSKDQKNNLIEKWKDFQDTVRDFEIQAISLQNSFVFNFVEGSLVKAVRNGDWLLLDEINLASSETLECIADLLADSFEDRSILLSERGDTESVKAHTDFRIFGCMNPSTDIGKRELPSSIRSRFSEIYVHSPDRDYKDLISIIQKYIGRFAISDDQIYDDIAHLYLEAKKLAEDNVIVDGANQKPHFSIRTLTRVLVYVCDIVPIYGLRRSLFEGFCMAFLTLLDLKSEEVLKPLIISHTIGKLKNMKAVISQVPSEPSKNQGEYVQFKHYWLRKGMGEPVPQSHYIITPSVEKNMLNLVRATASGRFPVLIQGPTSAGKTSMINFLAGITGHKFVRINNHEHTDLQEYVGSYVSDNTGKLVFKEGVLVRALREGHWIVLDELNLAPTDVLEALNRLLDDNRELFIPETQETVRPHPDFMLFATQNPPGIYGGRKFLSRAFRNRFLELHFDDIPEDELVVILEKRCKIAPSYCKKMVEVYKQLSVHRQSSRIFEQKNSFATLRDLFRWALRDAVGYEELAANGYMLLAEKVRKEAEKKLVKETIEKVMRVQLDMDAYYNKLENKDLTSTSSIVWTKAMKRLAVLVSSALAHREPVLLVGETGCGKTTICQILAGFLHKDLIMVNAHQNTETSDILGAQRPVRNRSELIAILCGDISDALGTVIEDFDSNNLEIEDLIKIYRAQDNLDKVDPTLVERIEDGINKMGVLFEWKDGPLVAAMKTGNLFLLDEISLADDSVLERLNSVLEPEKTLFLAEKGTEDSYIEAQDGFDFLATMNPGGDYGKKELSPALRNRFTEIWVPSFDNIDDVKDIVFCSLNQDNKSLCQPLVSFVEWFGKKFGGDIGSGVLSLRDILQWVKFLNSTSKKTDLLEAFLHGASMCFIDALGTNNTAHLAQNEQKLTNLKLQCVDKLSSLVNRDLREYYLARWEIKMANHTLSCGPFEIPRDISSEQTSSFSLEAPTTAANAMRIIRALQVHKSILLEGSPGVGKTSLVSALAKACGINLHRINLSEQTDLVDIFGSDIPVEGGKPGEFAWRDAPFLRAMQKGEWVLLDEMNLASQSVLEGLNACLDHRGQAYIPELDKTFNSHPDFIIFAAQNPQYQGGGRKGLPKSFINRFCVVYVDILRPEDLELISGHLYPEVPVDTRNKLIDFMAKLEKEVITDRRFGSLGGPWEFNLRDALRWMELLKTNSFLDMSSAFDFFATVISGRFRTEYDRKKALELFSSNFDIYKRDNIYNLTESFLQCNGAVLERDIEADKSRSFNLIPLQCNFPIIETIIHSVNINVPVILVGPPASGKTDLVRFMANVSGNELVEFSLNSEIDNMDLLGGYEQVDPARNIADLISKVKDITRSRIREGLQKLHSDHQFLQITSDFVNFLNKLNPNTVDFEKFSFSLKEYISLYPQEELEIISKQAGSLREKLTENLNLRFEWFDGLLVKAVETGSWLVLDNANLCSSSVLDRLNSLLETDGKLLMNECTSEDGQARVLEPHPKFRLFLTMDPKFGELSRAMRNRSVEIYVDPISDRATSFDRTSLDLPTANNEAVSADSKSRAAPVSSIIKCNDSVSRLLCFVMDIVENQELNYQAVSNIVYQCMPLYGTDNFEHFLHAIDGSSEFQSELIVTLQNALKQVRYLKENNALEKIQELFTGSCGDADNLRKLPCLTLNPEVNMYACRSIRDRNVFSKETSFYFEVLNNIMSIREHLLQVEERALAGKLTNLTFIESSAAENMGRELKKVSQVKIYDFIKTVHGFIEEFFISSTEDLFVKDNVYSFLNKIQMILYGLINCKDKNLSARIRIFYQLLKAWFAEESHIFDEKHRNTFDDVLGSMSKYLDMASGVSMENIWISFKGHYPRDLESWQRLENWVTLSKKFDEVVKEQFHDCFDSIIMLQNLIMSTFEKIKDGKVNEEEFEGLSKRLVEGISNLREISSSFNCKRQNEFSFEFNLLANFVQGVDNEKPSEVQKILLFTDNGDFASLSHQSNSLFQPYPQLFDHLWFIDNEDSMSFVRGYFTNDLCISSIVKCQDASAIPARNIPQTTDDIKYLATYLIRNSNSTLRDTRSEFTHLLFEWFSNILVANLAFFDEDGKNKINQIVSDSKSDNISISSLKEVCQGCVQRNFRNIVINYFIPAIELALNNDSFEQLGRAWVLFSFGCIQAYVPDAPYDPAIKEQLEKEMFSKLHNQMETIKNVWSKTREVISGDQPLSLEDYLTQDYSLDSLSESKVYREDSNIEPLFEEWKGFMEGIINNNLLSIIFKGTLEFGEQDLTALDIFHKSSERFLIRLSEKYNRYSDLNDILKGYTLGFRLGVELVTIASKNINADVKVNNSWCLDVLELSQERSVLSNFESIKDFIKKFDYSNSVPEQSMIFYINLCLCHKAYDTKSNLHTIFEDALQVIYYRWSLRHTKEKIEKEKKESIFRYKEADEDESDFKKMFPDYEDFIDDETSFDSRKNDSFDSIYSQVADLYMSAFVSREDISIAELVSQGSRLTKVLDRAKNTFMSGCNNDTVLHGLLQNLSESWHLLTGKKEEEPDFYRSPNPMEFKRASTLVNAIYNYTDHLIEQWPEHATLQIISRICDEFLSFPIKTPVAKLLQKIEQLYTHIAEWEKYAHKGVSFSSFMNDITNLIVSWRRFELSTWKLLFKYEDDSLNANLGLWWFHLYEVLLQPLLAGVLENDTVPKVLDALNLFLNNCALGEYHTRIRLLKSFKEHIRMIDSEGKIYNALSNFIAYREIFIPVIKEKIEAGKKALQKEIEEVILLASWKDVNIDALKQSSRRSHNNLYKIVRKYRDLIKSAVLPIIDGGLGHDLKENLIPLEFEPLMARYLSDDTVLIGCQKVASWSERDAYLKDSSLLNKNMVNYESRISKERIPSLKDYAIEIIEHANSLNHETPKVLTKENKKIISALKTQKRKLLSDTLKELKRIGLKSHIGSTILNNQGSVNNILSASNSFEGSYFEGCDAYYYGVLDILPKIRSAVATCSNDVPQADMMRGHGFLENLVLHLGEIRNPLVKFSNNVMKVSDSYKSFKLILEENMEGKTLIGCDFLAQKESVKSLSSKIFWLTKLIDYTTSTIEACSPFMNEIKLEIFFRAKSQLSRLDAHIKSTKTDVCSNLDENTLREFTEFLQLFIQELENWKNCNVNLAFMSEMLLNWVKGNNITLGNVSKSDSSSDQDMNDVENAFRKLSMSILISFQKIVEVNSITLNDEQDNWFEDSKARLVKYMKNLRVEHISERISQCATLVNKTRSKDSSLVYALVSFTLPQLYHYIEVSRNILTKCRENYEDTTIAASYFANILSELCHNGFCSPEKESEEKNNDALQDGTGLGDGEGVQNESKDDDIDEDDLNEEAQTENKDQDKGDKDEEDDEDAKDIEGDMAGELEDLSDQDEQSDAEEENELDEEVDDLNDDDPNAIDEKMWNEEARDDEKEKESDKPLDNSNKDGDMEGNDQEDQEVPENKEKKEGEENDGADESEEENDEDGDDNEGEDVGEQEDEVKNDETDHLEEHVPEADALDLPEDMKLDDDEENDHSNNSGDDESDSEMDIDDNSDVDENQEADNQEDQEVLDDDQKNMDEDNPNQEMDEGEENAKEEGEEHDNTTDTEEHDEEPGNESDEESNINNNDSEEIKNEAEAAMNEEGIDISNNQNTEEVDKDTATNQAAGESGEGADKEVSEEQDDVGASGDVKADTDDKSDRNEENNLENSRDAARESLKQLGDSLKEYHNRKQDINEASNDTDEPEKSGENAEEFQHLEGEETNNDTQALGSANQEQVQKINEDNMIEDQEEGKDDAADFNADEALPETMDEDKMNVENDITEHPEDNKDEALSSSALMKSGSTDADEDKMIIKDEPEDFNDQMDDERKYDVVQDLDTQSPPRDFEEARELWRVSDQATQELASGLCEQLRLILEPTKSTKLKGDYKTGKRLNMKRIIPYIASDFRKDKIWLRRTKPSKREYQVMLAIDDSKSMYESGSVELAFNAVALVCKALNQLESGDLSVVRFGEDVKVVHSFDKPFNGHDSGPKIFQWFDFQQTRTDVRQLCESSLNIFEEHKVNTDLWQLQIIISDGVCEDHETLKKLVRKAREERIMLVFVIIDTLNSEESIIDMSQVKYNLDPETNSMNLEVKKYLETFPFDFYVVVRNINELPEMLSLILRQYFSEVAST